MLWCGLQYVGCSSTQTFGVCKRKSKQRQAKALYRCMVPLYVRAVARVVVAARVCVCAMPEEPTSGYKKGSTCVAHFCQRGAHTPRARARTNTHAGAHVRAMSHKCPCQLHARPSLPRRTGFVREYVTGVLGRARCLPLGRRTWCLSWRLVHHRHACALAEPLMHARTSWRHRVACTVALRLTWCWHPEWFKSLAAMPRMCGPRRCVSRGIPARPHWWLQALRMAQCLHGMP